MIKLIKTIIRKAKYYFLYIFKRKCFWKCLELKEWDFLLISHLGGGTEFYDRNTYAQNQYVKMCPSASSNFYLLFLVQSNQEEKMFFIHASEFERIVSSSFNRILIGSLYGFRDIQSLIERFNAIKQINNIRMMYFFHDYHAICPSVHLIDKGYYCGVKCEDCSQHYDIKSWRMMWHYLFSFVDEVVCFSESSKGIVEKVYKNTIGKIIVKPHDISYIKRLGIFDSSKADKHIIGIVGNISNEAKGLSIVKQLLSDFLFYSVTFVMIGSTPEIVGINNSIVKYTGPYEKDNLFSIMERERVSCVLFPSVVPETFSFSLSELMVTGLPIISFNIGAQQEKLENYGRAVLVNNYAEMKDAVLEWIE